MELFRQMGYYERYIKRIIDFICALLILVLFSWLYFIIAILVKKKLGSPIIFKQPRPGIIDQRTGKETIFDLYKFRTMTDERDINGDFLPDEVRLGQFGRLLRSTSLDELPELFNILKGEMSFVGPRPQLVRDLVFMTDQQRMRHTAKPGLTGLAQVMGRNAISWEDKINWDLKYIERVSFINDLKIVFHTVIAVFKREGITDGANATALDYGDALLQSGVINRNHYDAMQKRAKELLENHRRREYGNEG